VAVEAVVFDVGETLVDETRMWQAAADGAGVPRFTLMGVVGGLAARGEQHGRVWEILGIEPPQPSAFDADDFYPDALRCLVRLRELGYRVGAAGNMPAAAEDLVRPHVDGVGSSARWGVEKPSPGFFARVIALAGAAPEKIAYVGDRVDNDIRPALDAGLVAVHVRRGPWAHLHDPPAGAISVRSLDELPDAFP
jgi:phosphoglycolate phosphatase-like HAD superfamily hydrolase